MTHRKRWLITLVSLASCGYDVVDFDEARIDPTSEVIVVGPVPQSAIDRLASSTGGKPDDKRLRWTYPDDDTAVPVDVAPLTLQWQSMAMPAAKPGMKPDPMVPTIPPAMGPALEPTTEPASEVYELTLGTGPGSLRVYSLEPRLTLSSERWATLLAAHLDGAVECHLRSLTTTKKGELIDGGARTFHVRGPLGADTLYFESSLGAMRTRVEDTAAAALVYPDASAHCQSTVAIAPDAHKLTSACSDAQGGVWTLPSLTLQRSIAPTPELTDAQAFDPTGTRLVQARADRLVVLDADTGAQTGEILGVRATQPDWSPDGSSIAFAYTTEPMPPAGPMNEPAGSSIARVVRRADGSFGPVQVLVPAGGAMGKTLRAPRYAPGGAWVVFEASEDRGDERKDGRLFVVRAEGGAAIPLGVDAPMGMKNEPRALGAWPTWVPGDRPDRMWLSYASVGDVGVHKLEPKLRQIWLVALDVLPGEPGVALPHAAFWLPSQPLAADNRRLLFTR